MIIITNGIPLKIIVKKYQETRMEIELFLVIMKKQPKIFGKALKFIINLEEIL